MKKQIAERIASEHSEYKIHSNYAGRDMCGVTTAAVEVPTREDVEFVKARYGVTKSDFVKGYLVY